MRPRRLAVRAGACKPGLGPIGVPPGFKVRYDGQDIDQDALPRPHGVDRLFLQRHEVDARGIDATQDVRRIVRSGSRQSIERPEGDELEVAVVRVPKQSLELRLSGLLAA